MKPSYAMLVALITLCAVATVRTQQPTLTSSEVLQQERRFALQARGGRSDVTPAAMLLVVKEAVAADPTNSELYRALGDVELFQARAAGPQAQPAGSSVATIDLSGLMSVAQRAVSGYERAIQLDPGNAVAVSGRGLMSIVSALLQQKPELTATALADLNRAVELAPSAVVPRLNRAFTAVNLRSPLRDTEQTTEDLKFLIVTAEGTRAGDMLHLLLGDLYAETGKADDARLQYQAAARRPASTAREQATARLVALDEGTLPIAQITAMRGSLAFNCAMCHAK